MITRRAFVQVTGGAALLAACGDDTEKPATDTADTSETSAPDTSVTETAEPETVAETIEETTPEVEVAPDVEPDTHTGPEVIGTFDPQDQTETPADFLFGVQAGDPSTSGAVLWTRYTGGEALEVVVFEQGGFGSSGDLYLREPVTAVEGFIHVDVDGLAAGTRYRYAFVGATTRSNIGSFLTAHSDRGKPVVTFGGVSCVNQSYRPYRTLTRASEENLDFFLLSGDTAYMDGAESLSDYRNLWRTAFDTDGYRALFASTGVYSTWDDHEVYDNWDPELVKPEILGYAKKTFLEHAALRLPNGAPEPWKIWRSQRWGTTLEVFVLDCRSERLPSTRFTNAPIYLSRAQMDWLKAGLRASPCTFKIIVNSVPITDMPSNFPQEKDRWEGYGLQRTEILGHVQGPPAIPGVLWLSGDFHFGAVTTIDPPGGKFDDAYEVFMGQGANMPNPVWPALEGLDGFPFVTGTNNYVRFVCDPMASPPTITATFIDGDGGELYQHVFSFPA